MDQKTFGAIVIAGLIVLGLAVFYGTVYVAPNMKNILRIGTDPAMLDRDPHGDDDGGLPGARRSA